MDEKDREARTEPETTPASTGTVDEPMREAPTAGAGEAEGSGRSEPEAAPAGTHVSEVKEGGEAAPATESEEDPSVRWAEFQPIAARGAGAVGENMDLLLDVTMPVTVELGSTEMCLRDILAVGPGSVIKLDRPLGKPLDILVNGEHVGRGEVVVVGEQFGVRVTELAARDRNREAGKRE